MTRQQPVRGRGPNAYVDVYTADDMVGPLTDAVTGKFADIMAMRHKEYPHINFQCQADAAGNLNTENVLQLAGGIGQGQLIGPREGYTWEIKRLAISSSQATGSVAVYVNSSNPTDLVIPAGQGTAATFAAGPQYYTWSGEQFVMRPNEVMHFVGNTLGANAIISISGQVIEVSVNKLGRASDL